MHAQDVLHFLLEQCMIVCRATVQGLGQLQAGDTSECLIGWPYVLQHVSPEAAGL